MDSHELLERLSNTHGVSGFEGPVREVIAELVTPLVDEVRVDALGNLIAIKRGATDFTLMLDAHMDEVGFMVQTVDDHGFITLAPLGAWDERLLPSHMMTVITRDGRGVEGVIATKPPHILKAEDRNKVIPLEDLFLDVGAASAQDAAGMGIHVGDPVVIHYPFRRIGYETVMGKALDDRAGCSVLIKALESLRGTQLQATIAAAFVVGEERGMIGAHTAAFDIQPEMALALEGTSAADIPGVTPARCPAEQGKGPAITVADNSIVVPQKIVRALEDIATREGIPYQYKTPSYGSTDAGAIHKSRGGVPCGVVSVPCRYIHSPFSTCRLSDFDNTWKLVAAFCKEATEIASR